ncbi:unnamed protein product [Closterium sp. NIES-54]
MVQQALQRFELQHSTVQRTPLAVDHRLTGPFPDKPFESSCPYAELVGCLMYLMTCTRPDLAFPLSVLACFVATGRHRPVHWTAAVRVAKYLTSTSGVELVLGGQQPVVLTGHYDSSYADDAETHRSTQGYSFSLGSGAVSWRSTRSSSVSTSTAEAEIYTGAMAAQELRWMTFLLADLGERPSSAPTLFTDNKASILLCREPRLESRVKHIHHESVGQPASAASDGVAHNDEEDDHDTTHPNATNAARSQPRVTISVPGGESTLLPPMPQHLRCFDLSQQGGPTVQAWLFTLNVIFEANYVSEDTAKIRYAVSLLRGPAMDWWCVILTKPMDYATLPTREGQTGPSIAHGTCGAQVCVPDLSQLRLRSRRV